MNGRGREREGAMREILIERQEGMLRVLLSGVGKSECVCVVVVGTE